MPYCSALRAAIARPMSLIIATYGGASRIGQSASAAVASVRRLVSTATPCSTQLERRGAAVGDAEAEAVCARRRRRRHGGGGGSIPACERTADATALAPFRGRAGRARAKGVPGSDALRASRG